MKVFEDLTNAFILYLCRRNIFVADYFSTKRGSDSDLPDHNPIPCQIKPNLLVQKIKSFSYLKLANYDVLLLGPAAGVVFYFCHSVIFTNLIPILKLI